MSEDLGDEENEAIRKHLSRTKHVHDPSIFDNANTTDDEIASSLFDLVIDYDLSPEAQSFIGGLFRAFYGASPYHKISVKRASPGGMIARAKRIENAQSALAMADKIDCAVADGVKLDALVLEAEQAYQISDREVFRRLKYIRQQRLIWSQPLPSGKPEPLLKFYIPQGYRVTVDGKLDRDG